MHRFPPLPPPPHPPSQRTDIRLNLLDPNLSPDTKHYARVCAGLRSDALAPVAMRIAWQPPADSGACPSSVAKYFADAGYRVRLMRTERQQHAEYGLRVPLLGRDADGEPTEPEPELEPKTDKSGEHRFYATAADVVEYVGMLSLGCELEADTYLSGYRCAGRSMAVGNAAVGQWRGLFTGATVAALLAALR